MNIKKYSIEQYIVFFLIFCSFGLVSSKTVFIFGIRTYIETATVASSIFIVYKLIMLKFEKEKYIEFFRKEKYFCVILIMFIITSIINALIIYPRGIGYVINKTIPFITLIFLMVYFKNETKDMINKYINFLGYIFIISFTLSIIMYLFKYTNGALSLSTGINLISFKESYDLYGEVRLYWLMSHKSIFVLYCTIGLIFINRSTIKFKFVKYWGIITSCICAILSNSMIGIVIYFFVGLFIIALKYKLIKRIINLQNKKIIIGSFLTVLIIFIVMIVIVVSDKRDLSTLGSRTFIWQAGMERFLSRPMGMICMPDNLWIKAMHNGEPLYFTNAHNCYINEFIENGIIVGGIYIILNAAILIKYLKVRDYLFSFFLVFTIVVFMNFEAVNLREMNYILFIAYVLNYYWSKYKTKEDVEEKKNE